jgi:hypothetical protein
MLLYIFPHSTMDTVQSRTASETASYSIPLHGEVTMKDKSLKIETEVSCH